MGAEPVEEVVEEGAAIEAVEPTEEITEEEENMAAIYVPATKIAWDTAKEKATWLTFQSEAKRILKGPLASKKDDEKLGLLFYWATGTVEKKLRRWCERQDPVQTIDDVDTIDKWYVSVDSLIRPHAHFFNIRASFLARDQHPNETVSAWVDALRDLWEQSEYEAAGMEMRDRLVLGCTAGGYTEITKKKGANKLSVNQILDILEAHEETVRQVKERGDHNVSLAKSQDPSKSSQRRGGRVKKRHNSGDSSRSRSSSSRRHEEKPRRDHKCFNCGGKYPHEKGKACPAKENNCPICKKNGHFKKYCRKTKADRKKKELEISAVTSAGSNRATAPTPQSSLQNAHDFDDNLDDEDICMIQTSEGATANSVNAASSKGLEYFSSISFEGGYTTEGKVDTGADVSCMPERKLTCLGLNTSDLIPSKVKVSAVGALDLQCKGTVTVEATINDITAPIEFHVLGVGSEILLGAPACSDFELAQMASTCTTERKHSVGAVRITSEEDCDYKELEKKWGKNVPLSKDNPLGDVMKLFPDAFDGKVGLFQGTAHLTLRDDAEPTQLAPRNVPLSIQPQLREELDKMERDGVIRRCPEVTDWVHNLVIARKKSGKLRICLDPRNLNKFLVRPVHYTASFEDAVQSFANAKKISTMDAKSAFWTVLMDLESQLLTAFNTPFRKYCFIRLPFGLSVSSEIFQQKMDEILEGIPGTIPVVDDIKIQGSTDRRHDLHLLETISKAAAGGLKFDAEKCQIGKEEVTYFGRLLTRKGMKPDPTKVKALQELAPPTDKLEIQSFLGTVQFMGAFIPNLAAKTNLIRATLKKDAAFIWTADHHKEFDTVIENISRETLLRHFDATLPTAIETDASMKGLGAVLIQEGQPIRFCAKSLTSAESNYSNIERELLAVLWAVEKLHVYTFGREVELHTDHKPLENIFLKPISLAPARLQRMLLRMSMYSVKVVYVGAKRVLISDTLSRLIRPGKDPAIEGLDVTIANIWAVPDQRLTQLQTSQSTDPICKDLRTYITDGWPNSLDEIPPPEGAEESVRQFWPFRGEMAVLDGVVMKGNRIYIPESERNEVLIRLHDAHQGVSSTLQRARRTIYWPKMQDDIQQVVEGCIQCQVIGKKLPRRSIEQASPLEPNDLVSADVFHTPGSLWLLIVDHYSGFVFTERLQNETTTCVWNIIKLYCRAFGTPVHLRTDNGPCFRSAAAKTFCDTTEIEHTTSSPRYHEGNGRAERSIQTVKKFIGTTKSAGELTNALNAFLDTPIGPEIPSPAELFLGRRIRSRLTIPRGASALTDSQQNALVNQRQRHLRDRKTRIFMTGDPVWYTDDDKANWEPGIVKSIFQGAPNSYVITNLDTLREYRRNVYDLKIRPPPRLVQPDAASDDLRETDLQVPQERNRHVQLPEHYTQQKITAPEPRPKPTTRSTSTLPPPSPTATAAPPAAKTRRATRKVDFQVKPKENPYTTRSGRNSVTPKHISDNFEATAKR